MLLHAKGKCEGQIFTDVLKMFLFSFLLSFVVCNCFQLPSIFLDPPRPHPPPPVSFFLLLFLNSGVMVREWGCPFFSVSGLLVIFFIFYDAVRFTFFVGMQVYTDVVIYTVKLIVHSHVSKLI